MSQSLEQLLDENEYVQISPEGYSMYPILCPGRDQVILKKLGEERIRRGQVLLYRRESGTLVLHRVFRVREDGIYMVGDNQSEVEGPLPREAFLARAVAFVRKGRRFSEKNLVYVVLTRIWLFLRPLRMPIMKPLAALKRWLRGFRKPRP